MERGRPNLGGYESRNGQQPLGKNERDVTRPFAATGARSGRLVRVRPSLRPADLPVVPPLEAPRGRGRGGHAGGPGPPGREAPRLRLRPRTELPRLPKDADPLRLVGFLGRPTAARRPAPGTATSWRHWPASRPATTWQAGSNASSTIEMLELATERVRLRVEPHTWDAFRLTALEGQSGAGRGGPARDEGRLALCGQKQGAEDAPRTKSDNSRGMRQG